MSTCGSEPSPDLLAVGQHRRLVLLALADHDDAVHVDRVQHGVHAVDGGLVGGLLVAAADVARGGQRGRLGDAHELEREVAIGDVARGHGHEHSGGLRGRSVVDARMDPPTAIRIVPRSDRYQPMPRLISLGGSPGSVDDPDVGGEAEGDDPDDRRHLAARPRQLVVADDDPQQDDRRERRQQQQPADDRVRVEGGDRVAHAVDVGVAVVGVRHVPGQENADRQQQSAHRRDDLGAADEAEVHRPGHPTSC